MKNLIDEFIRVGHFPIIASPDNINIDNKGYYGCGVVAFNQHANIKDAKEILEKVKPEIVHAHGYKAIFSSACKQLLIPCIITAHHGGILCPEGALLNYRDEICRIKANHKDCLPCVLKNIRGGIYVWRVLRLFPLKFRLVIGRFMEKLPFILYVTPVLKATLSIQYKADEWKTIYENASLIIAPSSGIAESMIRNGALTEKIKVLPHGIPLPVKLTFSEPVIKVKKEYQPLSFFYVGRICHVKGIHVMLAAFDRLKGSANLHIVGGAGNKDEERYMQRLQGKYKHNSQISWHGKVEYKQLYKLIEQYDILIHPAICLEVFGLNIAEALALGKPVIATRCGGPEIQIEDGVNGWLVVPNDINSLKLAMELASDRYLTNNLFKLDTSRVKSIEEHTKELIEIYEEIADRH